ncbi:hypothetical protein MKW94_023642, partial [Papaver nudicaule]|nr:hypothetical protein [Papaver nudicaule]
IVAYLMRMGANPEIPTDTNMYPLHHAAKEGHNGVIIFLHSFKNDINIDVSNDFGSPLQFACAYGQHETVKMLLQRYNAN